MELAKNHLDVGLFTNSLGPMLEFWQQQVGLPFEEVMATGGGSQQHRHAFGGGVLKINHVRDPLLGAPPSGYRCTLPIASRSAASASGEGPSAFSLDAILIEPAMPSSRSTSSMGRPGLYGVSERMRCGMSGPGTGR